MFRKLLRLIKTIVLPKGVKFRRLPLGIASGVVMAIDFSRNSLHYFGLYEIELNAHFRQLLRKGDRCFDVGGQGGYDALLLAKLTGGPVISFECDPGSATEMRETFERNPFDIRTVEAFVGAATADASLSLDDAATEHFVPDFIKLDIEGGEVDALRGATHLLETRRPSLIIEVHGREVEDECLSILRNHGYTPQVVDQRRWFREHRPIGHNRWLVCEGRPRAAVGAAQSQASKSTVH